MVLRLAFRDTGKFRYTPVGSKKSTATFWFSSLVQNSMGQSTPGGILLFYFSDTSCPVKEAKAKWPPAGGLGKSFKRTLWKTDCQDLWQPRMESRPVGIRSPSLWAFSCLGWLVAPTAPGHRWAKLSLLRAGPLSASHTAVAPTQDTNRPIPNHSLSGTHTCERSRRGHQLAKTQTGRTLVRQLRTREGTKATVLWNFLTRNQVA